MTQTASKKARILPPDPEGVAEAARTLRDGGLVAFPTETVYGLGADATSPEAVARIYAAKGRPAFNPLIAHVTGVAAARREGRFSETAERLAAAFWPGPLTLVQTEDLTLMQALRSVTSAPSDLLGLWQGRLAIGAPADVILINPDRPFIFDADSMLSRSKNSALDGRRLQGRAELTMVSGKIVHRAAA